MPVLKLLFTHILWHQDGESKSSYGSSSCFMSRGYFNFNRNEALNFKKFTKVCTYTYFKNKNKIKFSRTQSSKHYEIM